MRVNAPFLQIVSPLFRAGSGAEYPHRGLFVRMPDIGGAEKPACFSYPPPSVEIVWFEESGHMIPMESPAAFQRAIIEKVLPTTR